MNHTLIINLTKQENKKPLIWQNENKIFIIRKFKNWNWSIEVKFDWYDEINLYNLFLIIKCYVLDINIICYAISIIRFDKEEKMIISEILKINKFKKISFFDFKEWIENKLIVDSKYNVKDEFVSFVFHFEKNIIILKNIDLDFLVPIYPWKKELIEIYENEANTVEFLKNKIKILEKELNKIKIISKK